jgi:hypothetical protein
VTADTAELNPGTAVVVVVGGMVDVARVVVVVAVVTPVVAWVADLSPAGEPTPDEQPAMTAKARSDGHARAH